VIFRFALDAFDFAGEICKPSQPFFFHASDKSHDQSIPIWSSRDPYLRERSAIVQVRTRFDLDTTIM
jgi:hypothetical protein